MKEILRKIETLSRYIIELKRIQLDQLSTESSTTDPVNTSIRNVYMLYNEVFNIGNIIIEYAKNNLAQPPHDIYQLWFNYLSCLALFHLRCIDIFEEKVIPYRVDTRMLFAENCLEQLPIDSKEYRLVCFYIGSHYAEIAIRLSQSHNHANVNNTPHLATAALNYFNACAIHPSKIDNHELPANMTENYFDLTFVEENKLEKIWHLRNIMITLLTKNVNIENSFENIFNIPLNTHDAKKPPRLQKPKNESATFNALNRSMIKTALFGLGAFLDEQVKNYTREYANIYPSPFSHIQSRMNQSKLRLFGEKEDTVPSMQYIEQAIEAFQHAIIRGTIDDQTEEHIKLLQRSPLNDPINNFLKTFFPASIKFRNMTLTSLEDALLLIRTAAPALRHA